MSLLDNLISYWKLDEVSGNAIDAHGANTLTANNSPGSAAGAIGTARTFNGTNQLFSGASNSDLQAQNASLSIQSWVWINSKATDQFISGKWAITGNNREYRLIYVASQDRFFFQVSANGSSAVSAIANGFGAVSTATWYHLIGWHDAAADQIGISVNGIANTASHSAGVFSGSSPFYIANNDQAIWLSGRVDEAAFWKRTLTSQERTRLYSGGAGLSYDDFGGGSSAAAVHFFTFGF